MLKGEGRVQEVGSGIFFFFFLICLERMWLGGKLLLARSVGGVEFI